MVKNWSDREIAEFSASFRRAFARVLCDLGAHRGPAVLIRDTEEEPTDRSADELLAALEGRRDGG
jgi:hypothetical protein